MTDRPPVARFAMALGVMFILMGLWIGVFPDLFLSVADWESQRGLYLAAGIRVVIGAALILTAPATRYPNGLRILGVLVLIAGLGLALLPIHIWVGLIRWWFIENAAVFRVLGGVAGVLLGTFLVHSALPRGVAAEQDS